MASEKLQKAARENGKKGGRPVGSMSPVTLERKNVEAAVRQRIFIHADEIINAQLAAAKGLKHVYRIDERMEGKKVIREHVLVTDPDEIKSVLDEHEGSDGVVDDNYYYISTKDPNTMAGDSLLNRGIGKPTDNVDITSGGEIISQNPILDDLTNKINAIYKGTSSGSNGELADLVDSETPDKK